MRRCNIARQLQHDIDKSYKKFTKNVNSTGAMKDLSSDQECLVIHLRNCKECNDDYS